MKLANTCVALATIIVFSSITFLIVITISGYVRLLLAKMRVLSIDHPSNSGSTEPYLKVLIGCFSPFNAKTLIGLFFYRPAKSIVVITGLIPIGFLILAALTTVLSMLGYLH